MITKSSSSVAKWHPKGYGKIKEWGQPGFEVQQSTLEKLRELREGPIVKTKRELGPSAEGELPGPPELLPADTKRAKVRSLKSPNFRLDNREREVTAQETQCAWFLLEGEGRVCDFTQKLLLWSLAYINLMENGEESIWMLLSQKSPHPWASFTESSISFSISIWEYFIPEKNE